MQQVIFFVLILFLVAAVAGRVQAASPVTVMLVGDSTVTDNAGWGAGFKELVTDEVTVLNLSRGGRSSRTFQQEGSWTKALANKADYVFIQFGHNDEPGKDRSTDRETEYPVFMRKYVADARAAGMKPVLVTSLVRRQFQADGKIKSSLARHAEIVREIAKEMGVPLIDLHGRSLAVCDALGREACVALMSSPKADGSGFDGTHLTRAGSQIMGALVADEVRRAIPELVPYLRPVPASSVPPAARPSTQPAAAAG